MSKSADGDNFKVILFVKLIGRIVIKTLRPSPLNLFELEKIQLPTKAFPKIPKTKQSSEIIMYETSFDHLVLRTIMYLDIYFKYTYAEGGLKLVFYNINVQ